MQTTNNKQQTTTTEQPATMSTNKPEPTYNAKSRAIPYADNGINLNPKHHQTETKIPQPLA